MLGRAAAGAALAAALAAPLAAQPQEVAGVPLSTPTVAAIRIIRLNVFDPAVKGEDWWPFRVANRIHFLTQERVVRRELLLAPGDPWDPLKALESERNLRANGSFRRAEVRAVPRPDRGLDLEARTQDSWTTIAQLAVGTEGGDDFFIYGVEENNILGLAKSMSFTHSQIGPKITNDLRYTDPRLAGTRFRLSSVYAATSKGDSIGADVARPFFSLETPYAMGAGWTRFIEEGILYHDGAERSKFLERSQSVQMSYGLRLEPDRFFVQRVEGGWFSSKNQFSTTADTLPGTLPVNREQSGPSLAYSWIRPRYVKETYINKMERVEDFNLGNELRAFGGYMGQRTGSDRDRWIFNALDQQGLSLGPGRFALAQAGVSGRLLRGRPDNVLLFANANLFWKAAWLYPQTWVAHLEANSGRSLDGENQVILGGDTGLRGYKNNSFTGGRSVLLNLENRFFFPGERFHLLRLGGAVFLDSGAVVPEGSGFSFRRFKSDLGLGLRVASTRSRGGGVVRIDLAYAMNPGPGGGRWVVSIRGGQAFEIFNSSTRRVRQTPGPRLNDIAPPAFPSLR